MLIQVVKMLELGLPRLNLPRLGLRVLFILKMDAAGLQPLCLISLLENVKNSCSDTPSCTTALDPSYWLPSHPSLPSLASSLWVEWTLIMISQIKFLERIWN